MTRFTKRLLVLSVIVLAAFVIVCVVDYFGTLAALSLSNGVRGSIWAAFMQKPLAFLDIAVVCVALWLIGIVILVWQWWLQRQKAEQHAQEVSKEELRRAVQQRYQKRFWVSLALYTAIILLIIAAFFLLKDSFIWYADDPWFSLLLTMRNLFPFAMVALWLGGVLVLLFNQWQKSATDVVGLIDSIEQMQTGTYGETIGVPENLSELGPVLQDMFDTSCENKRVASEAEKRKSDLVLYLAHDLKTPLTSVLGYLSLLEENPNLTDEQKQEYIGIAKQKALRLENLTSQFFEISRFSLHEDELERSSFDLGLLLQQLSDEFYPIVSEQGKTLELTLEKDLLLYADAPRLARVFDNILRNALAYSFAKSTIEISARREGSATLITITNRGEIIPPEQLDIIFEKFFRLDESRTSETGGSGLGLAIAREIVMMHGGTITATSEEETTSFEVILPLSHV